MGSSQEKRPHEQQPSPFDSAGGAATQKVGTATGASETPGTLPGPNLGPTAGAGPGSAAPFMGLYDAPAGSGQAGPPATTKGGGSDPHVTLFTGITAETQDAKDIAAQIDPNAGSYAGYDGTHTGTTNPGGLLDHLYDATAVLTYSKIGNQVDLVPARDSHGKLQYDANGNVKYDIDYGMFGGSDLNFLPEKYQSAQELGQAGADAVLHPKSGDVPGKTEAITVDAHSGGGQTAFFTALELYQKGYTDINVVGFDMAMTPEQRQTLEKLGVDVSNTTTHINAGPVQQISPVGALIQWAMGGSDEKYYDNSLELGYGDVFTSNDPMKVLTEWHEFHHNDSTLDYIKQQNTNQSATKPGKARPDLFSSDINLKEKSASVDIGGPGGLGAYVNLSEGQLDLNVFGHHVDIDQGVRNAAKTVTRAVDKAKDLGHDANEWVQDKWQAADSWVQDKAQSANHWVQDKTQAATNWVQDKTQAAGDWLQGTTSAVSNWLFGGKQSAGSPTGSSTGSSAGSPTTQAKSPGALAGAKAGAGSSPGPVTGKSSGAAKPTAGKSATGSGTVVTAPKDGPGSAPAPRSPSKSASSGKAADDIARPVGGASSGTSGSKSATQNKAGADTAPKSDSNKSTSATQPKSPTNASKSPSPGKAADDVAPRNNSNSSKPAKSSSKALDDAAPKHSASGSRDKEDRFRHS